MYLSSIIFRLALVLGYVDTTTSLLNFMATRQISGLSVSFPSSSSLNQKHVFSSSTRFLSMTSSPDSISVGSSGKPKLDSTSLWRLRILFQKQGFKEQEALFRVRYIPSRNYEPPQGRVLVQDDYNGVVRADERGLAGSWTLSEDKDDRKDGLWICKFMINQLKTIRLITFIDYDSFLCTYK